MYHKNQKTENHFLVINLIISSYLDTNTLINLRRPLRGCPITQLRTFSYYHVITHPFFHIRAIAQTNYSFYRAHFFFVFTPTRTQKRPFRHHARRSIPAITLIFTQSRNKKAFHTTIHAITHTCGDLLEKMGFAQKLPGHAQILEGSIS